MWWTDEVIYIIIQCLSKNRHLHLLMQSIEVRQRHDTDVLVRLGHGTKPGSAAQQALDPLRSVGLPRTLADQPQICRPAILVSLDQTRRSKGW